MKIYETYDKRNLHKYYTVQYKEDSIDEFIKCINVFEIVYFNEKMSMFSAEKYGIFYKRRAILRDRSRKLLKLLKENDYILFDTSCNVLDVLRSKNINKYRILDNFVEI